MRGHGLPVGAVSRDGDLVGGGQTVAVLRHRAAVAAPDHAADLQRLGKLQLHPAAASLAGDPRPRVAVAAIVDVLKLVKLAAGVAAGSRRCGLAGHVAAVDGKHLQLVNAGLSTRGRQHGHAEQAGGDRSKGVDRGARDNRRSLDDRRRLLGRRHKGERLKGDQLRGDLSQLLLKLRNLLGAVWLTGLLDRPLAMLHAGKDGCELVVVALRHGVKLVVVAAGTANRETKKGRAGRAHHVVQLISPLRCREHRVRRLHLIPRPCHEEAGRLVVALSVSGDLPADKRVVGHVTVEGIDHPVAIRPGIGPHLIHLKAMALGKPHDIEPVPRPPLAIPRRGEQLVDQIAVGLLARAGLAAGCEKGVDLLGRWGQADQIKGHAADQGSRIGLGIERQAMLAKRGGKKGIDGV